MNGKVKFFNRTKNFGFIVGEDDKDYFVHLSQVEGGEPLNENDSVEFEAGSNEKGAVAEKVKRV